MKKFLSVVLVAVMAAAALASCSGDEATTTTVPGTTTAGGAAQNTTVVTPFATETEETDGSDVPTPPKVKDDGLEELLAGKISLNEAGKIDMESLASVGFTTWNEETENIDRMFDTIDTYDEWYFDENGDLLPDADPNAEGGPTGGGPGKVGGPIVDPTFFYFGLTEKAKIEAYVITTGNDNSRWPGRNPVEWTLYATNDLATYEGCALDGEEFDETKWAKLDYVYDGMLIEDNFVACGYEIDAANQGEYQYYVWKLGYNNGQMQITELDLFVAAE